VMNMFQMFLTLEHLGFFDIMIIVDIPECIFGEKFLRSI
jgi:hypothetical protein